MFTRLTDRLEVDMENLLSNTGLPNTLSRQNQEENDQLDVCSLFPSLSFQERLGGCVGCMILGYLLSFGSFFRFRDLLRGSPLPFVLFSTLGNVISLVSQLYILFQSCALFRHNLTSLLYHFFFLKMHRIKERIMFSIWTTESDVKDVPSN